MTTAIPNQALPRECDAYLMVMDRSWDTCTADATEPHETRVRGALCCRSDAASAGADARRGR